MKQKALITSMITATLSLMLVGCAERLTLFEPSPQRKIMLQSRIFTPKAGIEKQLIDKIKITPRKKVHAMVQFNKRLSLEDHKFLKDSGILIQRYLGDTTYEVSFPKGTIIDKGKLRKMVRWSGMYKPQDKLRPLLAKRQFYDWAIDEATGKLKLLVQFFPDVSRGTISRDLASLGLKGKRHGANNTWAVLADKDRIKQIIKLDSVKSVQQGPIPFLPLNDGGRRVSNSNEAQQQTYNTPRPGFNKVSGSGIRIGICEWNGLDEDHDDFKQITAAGNAGVSRVYNQDALRNGSHGTHVASIAAGNGFNSENNGLPAFSLRGHAPEAEIGDYARFIHDTQSYHDAIVNDGTDVSNHSHVQSYTVYDAEAASLDIIVRGDATDDNGNPIPAVPQVWAAGNNGDVAQHGNEEGYYAVFTSAKNTISVGGVDTRDRRLYKRTSLGPTFDGRIKPDIVAPGCTDRIAVPSVGIQAADNDTQGYTGKCGTSMAAPVVSGIIALMMEQFQDTYGNLPDYPSTYKAMLIHSAIDMIKTQEFATREFDNPDTTDPVLYHAGPDFATGYGLVDAEGARDLVTQQDRWKEPSMISTGATNTWCISVPEGSKEIKVVIAWDDEPGSTTTAETVSKLVNDLDLELIDPDGNKYLPWTLDPLPLTANPGDGALDPIQSSDVDPAYRGVDHLNNVEMVSVCLPKAGLWRAIVRGFNLPNGNAQPYSLVSSHDITTCYFILPPPYLREYREIYIGPPLPWGFDIPHFIPDIDQERWIIDSGAIVPINEICKYVIDCPGCEGSGWSYCPGLRMKIENLPRDANIVVFNQDSKILLTNTTNLPSRTLQIKEQRPGDKQYLLITDRTGKPYPEKLNLRIGIKPI